MKRTTAFYDIYPIVQVSQVLCLCDVPLSKYAQHCTYPTAYSKSLEWSEVTTSVCPSNRESTDHRPPIFSPLLINGSKGTMRMTYLNTMIGEEATLDTLDSVRACFITAHVRH